MQIQHARFLLALAALTFASCGDAPRRVGGGLFSGEVRISADVLVGGEGYLFVCARPAGTRAPLLIRKYSMHDPAVRADGGDRVVDYELTEADFMGGLAVTLPDKMELKIYYDPDGIVETREGVEAVIVPVVGRRQAPVGLSRGMGAPFEPPSTLVDPMSQPSSRPTSRPVAE